MLSRRRRLLALTLIGMVLLGACGSGTNAPAATSAAGSQAAPWGAITMRLPGDWTTFDIMGNLDSSGGFIANALYDRMVAFDNGKQVPYLATSWKATASEVTFTMRKDATCADGTPLTPTVAANSWKRLFDPKTPAFARPRLFGPGPYAVSADDAAGTVTVKLGTPSGGLLQAFQHSATSIVCPAGLVDADKQLLNGAFGSGPYVLAEAVRGDRAVLKLRKDWKWGPKGTTAADLPEQITLKVIANATTAANLMVTGGLDFARVDGADVPRLIADKSLTVAESHSYAPFPLIFQQKAGSPTADPRVRRALMGVVDPKAWNQAAFDGRGIVTAALAAPDVECSDSSVASIVGPVNVEKSQGLLREAGWNLVGGKLMKDGKQMQLTVISSQTFYQRAAPEYLQSQFNRLGIDAIVRDTDQPTFLIALRGAGFDVVVVAGTSAPPMISYTVGSLSGALPPSGSNYGHIADPEWEKAIDTAMGTTDCAAWATVQRMALEKGHAYPLSSPVWSWFGRGINAVATSAYLEFWTLRRAK